MRKDARILDLGCGSGAFLGRLRAMGCTRLCGVDIDPPKPSGDGIVYATLDLDTGHIPFADASFDLIVAIEVVEHGDGSTAAVSKQAVLTAHDQAAA